MPATKFCSKCDVEKPLSEFHLDSKKRLGVRSTCKACVSEYGARRYHGDPQKYRDRARELHHRRPPADRAAYNRAMHLRLKYGLTVEEYEALVVKQGGVCALCGKPQRGINSSGKPQILSIDHDHATGRVRGLLCNPCNSSLGRLGDTPTAIARVLAYVSGGG